MTENSPKLSKKFECNKCNYSCRKGSDFNKHLASLKHKKNDGELPAIHLLEYRCKCGKTYSFRQGLSVHRKKCTYINELSENPVTDNKDKMIELLIKENGDFKNIILEFMKNSSDVQQQLVDICKTNNTVISNNNNNINSHNKTFNLQFFLNEQCKDAMNISDFADSFELELSDLESVGDLGYVEGITKIFVDKLNSMDIYKRPIHCSDAKREILYVKDDNKWEKEEKNNPKIRYAIKTISFRNMKLAVLWSETYPESKDCDSHVNERYMKLIKESTGGSGETVENENKIIRRIAKEIVIDKSSK
jgi:hypothetical protein